MEAFTAEETNPVLYGELMSEFANTFNRADANSNGVLDMREFKVF